jgi:TM2 domain-containing membrane protein YozV
MWNQRPARNDQERERQPDAHAWDGTPLYGTQDTQSSGSSSSSPNGGDTGAALAGGLIAFAFVGVGWVISEFRKPSPVLVPAGASKAKSPVFSSMLSLVIPGAGQISLGQRKKGLLLLFAVLLTWTIGVGWLIGLISAIDAYGIGQKLKRGALVQPWEFGLGADAKTAWMVAGISLVVIALLIGISIAASSR